MFVLSTLLDTSYLLNYYSVSNVICHFLKRMTIYFRLIIVRYFRIVINEIATKQLVVFIL